MTLKKVSDSDSRVMTITDSLINIPIYRCLKIRGFRIQSVVGKDPVELEQYLEKKSLFLKKI
jgi:hypothetical protein